MLNFFAKSTFSAVWILSWLAPVVVIGHFVPWWAMIILTGIYETVYKMTGNWSAIVHMIISALGIYYSYIEFPSWFFVMYLIIFILSCINILMLTIIQRRYKL